jgi:hypothetical protein
VRRWRPFLRRAARTFRPPAVFMRDRNPCVLARRLLRGWYVRFGKTIPLHSRRARLAISSRNKHTGAASAAYSESSSVLALRQKGQEYQRTAHVLLSLRALRKF